MNQDLKQILIAAVAGGILPTFMWFKGIFDLPAQMTALQEQFKTGMDRLETRLDQFETRMDRLEARMETKFDAIDKRFDSISIRLDTLNQAMFIYMTTRGIDLPKIGDREAKGE